MTREEAIKVLKHTVGNINWDAEREEIYFTDEWVQAYEMAIDALKEQPVANCHQLTIADHIRAMSDEELAVFIADEIPHGDCHNCDLECCTYREGDKFYSCCKNAFYKWLKQPYKEET